MELTASCMLARTLPTEPHPRPYELSSLVSKYPQPGLVTHICNPSTKWGEGWCLRDGSVVKSEDYSHRGLKSLVCSTQVRQLTATIPVPGIEHLWCPCALVCGMFEHACVHTHTYTHKANIFFFLYHNLLFLSIISLREVFYWSIC